MEYPLIIVVCIYLRIIVKGNCESRYQVLFLIKFSYLFPDNQESPA